MNDNRPEPNSTNVAIGQRIKLERQRLELGQAAFSLLVGVSKTSQFNYEAGDRMPDASYLLAAHKAGMDTHYVITGEKRELPAAVNVERNSQLLKDVIAGVLDALADQGLKLSNDKVAQLIDLIYEYEAAQTAVNEQGLKRTTERFLRLVAA